MKPREIVAEAAVSLFRRLGLGLEFSNDCGVTIQGTEQLDDRTRETVEHLFAEYEPELVAALDGTSPEEAPKEYTLTELAALEIPEDMPSLPLLGQPGYIIEGWSHIVAALPKTGKTEILFASAIDWARQGRSVYWISEEQAQIWHCRVRRRLSDLPENFVVVPVLGPEECQAALDKAGQDNCEVVVVDTVRHVLGLQDENSNSEVVAAVRRCEERFRGKTRIYLHHVRKGAGEHGTAVAGGTAFTAAVDRVLEIRHVDGHDTRRRIHVISRIATPNDLLVGLEDETPVALGDPAQYTVAEIAKEVTAALEGQGWLTQKQILELLGNDAKAPLVKRALDGLLQQGVVERDPPEKKQGATYKYRLAAANGNLNFTSTPRSEVEEVKLGEPQADANRVASTTGNFNFTSTPKSKGKEVKSGEPETHGGRLVRF